MTEITAKNVSAERDLLIAVYEAFNRREVDSILAVMHPQVEWPNGMEGGWVHGREAVRAYWARQWGLLDPHVEPVRFEADGAGRIVVDVHQVVRDLTGTVLLDRMVQHVYLIRDGLIRHMEIRE
jgi:ketosteroid isomerase-like protein